MRHPAAPPIMGKIQRERDFNLIFFGSRIQSIIHTGACIRRKKNVSAGRVRDSLESYSSERGSENGFSKKIPFSRESGFSLFREVFLNQLTRILNAALGRSAAHCRRLRPLRSRHRYAVLLLKLLLEHFRDLIGLTHGRAGLSAPALFFMPASMNAPLSAPHISMQPMPKPKPSR